MKTYALLYTVMEHYTDEAPEPFGDVLLDHVPEPGEVLALHWFDGQPAYDVQVLHIDEKDPLLVHVMHLKAPK